MALFFLSSFFIFSTSSSLVHSSYVPPLLFLTCIPSPSNANPIQNLLDNLTMEAQAPISHYTTFRQGPYRGIVQCRPGISPDNCALCKETARTTILNHCQHSNGVSAWFDGCYVQISSDNEYTNTSNHSCSGRTDVQDLARFEPALGELLLMLRADAAIPTRRGFSHREIGYGESKIYGLVECVRSVPTQECDSCVAEATDKILFYCGGKNRGVLVRGMCLVRFESSEFYHRDLSSERGVSGNYFSVGEGENGGSKKKVVMVYWSGGVGCFVLVVLLGWLLRRVVLNRAKVGTSDFAIAGFDPTPAPSKTVH